MHSIKKTMCLLKESVNIDSARQLKQGILFAISAVTIACVVVYAPSYIGKLVLYNDIWKKYSNESPYGVGMISIFIMLGVCFFEFLHGTIYAVWIMSHIIKQWDWEQRDKNIYVVDVENQLLACEIKKRYAYFQTIRYVRNDELHRIMTAYTLNTVFIIVAIYFWKPFMIVTIYAGGSTIIDICMVFAQMLCKNVSTILTKSR